MRLAGSAGADPAADARLGGYLQAYQFVRTLQYDDLLGDA